MVDALRLAKALVDPLVRTMLSERRRRDERSRPLSDLINVSLLDDYKKRKFRREVEAIRDAVAQRLESFSIGEWANFDEGDRAATLSAVADAFESANLTDTVLMATNANPVQLARHIRSSIEANHTAIGLSGPANSFFERLVTECSTVYAQLVVQLSSFGPRSLVELLDRTSSLSIQIEHVLRRLPQRTIEAPDGTDHDVDFMQRYLNHISASLDVIELFGIDVRTYSPDTALSVAYISLTVSPESTPERNLDPAQHTVLEQLNHAAAHEAGIKVEHALGHSPRILIRGEAGSGKTTLLQWLAVNSARSSFKAELSEWNQLTPFLVKLRNYAGNPLPTPERMLEGVADPIIGLMPTGWVHRQLSTGRSLILIDGVDELAASDRKAVRDWIRNLLFVYPNNRIVVTSRPHAAASRWLKSEEFTSANIDRMRPSEVQNLICHWHNAIRQAKSTPCNSTDLHEYERSIKAQLDSSPHLQGIATSPLLCAMLCALNLDRHSALPLDRMGVYAAALDMLLERRDIERKVPSYKDIDLRARDKIDLLQHLAWRLSINGRTQLTRDDAIQRLSERLATMPLSNSDPELILDHLLQRSGIIRQPAVDRIDFVHRTFQEYLTARETAEQGDVGLLVGYAHLDTWRETIIMAAGHGNHPTRQNLLDGILDRADTEPRHSRSLRLLAAACLETIGSITGDLRNRIEYGLSKTIPPRRINEAQSLASAGPALIHNAPRNLHSYSDTASRALARSVALVGGPQAIQILGSYAADQRMIIRQELFDLCGYFNPKEYAEIVLSRMPEFFSRIWIRNRSQLQAVRNLSLFNRVDYLSLHEVEDLNRDLENLPPISSVWFHGEIEDISALVTHADSLTRVVIWSKAPITDLEPLRHLRMLESLVISHPKGFDNLEHLETLSRLKELWLYDCDRVQSFSVLLNLPALQSLRIATPAKPGFWKMLADLPGLDELDILGSIPPPTGLRGIASARPELKNLRLMDAHWLDELSGITGISNLEQVHIDSSKLADIRPLNHLPELNTIDLACPMVHDLAPLADCPNLKTLYLRSCMRDVDLSPLKNQDLTLYVDDRATFKRWKKKLGSRVNLQSFGL
ncbi:NACHT domain-containing protein [Lentzea sp. BCCO 10_0061]|uniref:NACHT domain-containing protein n=1 Tax=Lentzea sokolovensis TaxID=3095429 RepID=A0ABU4V9G1_9PSEU|nr:NACHT domain-containing protein [Lentzea sp. BCCO 10_0061]MDX8148436.1 NACHT domain-containing protein [Lentzea sp. BCCO 10_0061]